MLNEATKGFLIIISLFYLVFYHRLNTSRPKYEDCVLALNMTLEHDLRPDSRIRLLVVWARRQN